MSSHLSHASPPGITRLRQHVVGATTSGVGAFVGLFDRLECGCVGGAAIDGTCMDCGAPSLL